VFSRSLSLCYILYSTGIKYIYNIFEGCNYTTKLVQKVNQLKSTNEIALFAYVRCVWHFNWPIRIEQLARKTVLPWGRFLEGPEKFSHPESHSKISNLMTIELFYSHTLNMNRGSLHTRSFRRIHLWVFRYRWTKNVFTGPKSFRGFRETGPWRQMYVNRKDIEVGPRFSLETTFNTHEIISTPISDCKKWKNIKHFGAFNLAPKIGHLSSYFMSFHAFIAIREP